MGYLHWYIAEETARDFKAGWMTYRELLRRFTLLTGSSVAALTLAITLGCTPDSAPAPTATPPPATATAPPSPQPAATQAPSPTASPVGPATATAAPGVTVPPDDPAITAGEVTFASGTVTLMGYLARPKADGRYPAVLVIHENRGMLPHFPDVARRLAKEGYAALALDLLSREGGTAKLADPAQATALLGQAGETRLVEDMNGAVRYLAAQPFVQADRIGAIGFCFGGGMVWLLSVRNPDIKASVPFYGPRPPLNEVENIRAPVLGIYGANDSFINPGIPDLEAALKQHNKSYEMKTYPGAGHAFFNDTGRAYNAEAALAAWRDSLSFLGRHLKG